MRVSTYVRVQRIVFSKLTWYLYKANEIRLFGFGESEVDTSASRRVRVRRLLSISDSGKLPKVRNFHVNLL